MRARSFRQTRTSGFTLLEVLVAMAILSLGLIAVFSGMSQSIDVTTRLKDKTIATWVATNRITEIQVTGDVPDSGSQRDEVEMAGVEWTYELRVAPIPDLEMRRIDIDVSLAATPDDILASVIGFVPDTPAPAQSGNPQTGGGQNNDSASYSDFGSGWERPKEFLGTDR